jgi:hypothetical protein
MRELMIKRISMSIAAVALLVVTFGAPASAATTGQFWLDDDPGDGVLELSLTSHGDATAYALSTVLGDWNASSALDVSSASRPLYVYNGLDVCDYGPTAETRWNINDYQKLIGPVGDYEVHFCNDEYGENGWLGVAVVWYSQATNEIVFVQTMMNDSYLTNASPDDYLGGYSDTQVAIAKRHIACQEIGHAFGLDHQKGPKAETCMNDQFGLLSPNFVSPNGKDYGSLASLYGGGGGTDSDGSSGGPDCSKNPNAGPCRNLQGIPGNGSSHGPLARLVITIPA